MNHYVMDSNSQMLHRGTLEDCKAWSEKMAKQFRDYGMPAPAYRIFYDSGTEPVLTIGGAM